MNLAHIAALATECHVCALCCCMHIFVDTPAVLNTGTMTCTLSGNQQANIPQGVPTPLSVNHATFAAPYPSAGVTINYAGTSYVYGDTTTLVGLAQGNAGTLCLFLLHHWLHFACRWVIPVVALTAWLRTRSISPMIFALFPCVTPCSLCVIRLFDTPDGTGKLCAAHAQLAMLAPSRCCGSLSLSPSLCRLLCPCHVRFDCCIHSSSRAVFFSTTAECAVYQ